MTQGASYTKDSKAILLKLQEHFSLTSQSTLLSADVVSLYPSIVLKDAYDKIRTYLTNNTNLPSNEVDFIMDLFQWVMNNNYCKFSDAIFKQIKGVAMGQPCAVVFAVIYLLQLEVDLLKSIYSPNRPLFFIRFIDDIFAIFKCTSDALSFITLYNNLHTSIKLTYDIADTVTIMDLTVTITKPLDRVPTLSTSIFQKATNKYLYLTPHSYHHPTIFHNFITSELKRYRLYCSEDKDFDATKTAFRDRLLARGYEPGFLLLLFNAPIHRAQLLIDLTRSYQTTTTTPTEELQPLVFITARTPRTQSCNIQACLAVPEYVYSTIAGKEIFNRVIVCNKTTDNLEQLLITSDFTPADK
jgi:hypothetical protein